MSWTKFIVIYCDGPATCTYHNDPMHGEHDEGVNEILRSTQPRWVTIKGKHYCPECQKLIRASKGHDWVRVAKGSDGSLSQGYRFCTKCDREEYDDKQVREGHKQAVCK